MLKMRNLIQQVGTELSVSIDSIILFRYFSFRDFAYKTVLKSAKIKDYKRFFIFCITTIVLEMWRMVFPYC